MKPAPEAKWQTWSRLACIGISFVALAWIFRRIELVSLVHVLARVKVFWLAAAWAIFGIGFLLAAARWHVVLRLSGCQVHGAATVRTVLIGHLFNTILFGPTGGDIAKAALYARWYSFASSIILATCVLDRFIGGVGFFILAGFTPGLAVYGGRWSQRVGVFLTSPRFAWVAGTIVALSIAAHLLRQYFSWPAPLGRLTRTFLSTGCQLLRRPGLALRALAFAVLSHLCISCVFFFSLLAVTHTPFSVAALFWIFPVISLVTAAPITFAGAGLREGAALFLLGLYGIPAADAVAASLLVLVTYLVWAMISGLLFWRGQMGQLSQKAEPLPRTISVVIPTLNEAESLPETVSRARALSAVIEVIVVDADSADATVAVGERLGCQVLRGPRSRGAQLRLGAARARGDVIMLLHADTWVPVEADRALLNCLRDRLVVAGGFWKVFREKQLLMAGSRFRCALRLLLFGRILGDQVMFVRRAALESIGGVPDVPLMEEFELCRRLRPLGRLALASATVTTSARRFAKLGVLRTYLRMWHVTFRYYLGASLRELRKLYERD
jgi:rSAM/selenodomain-associated transferase 2